jgi:hypothetical protein
MRSVTVPRLLNSRETLRTALPLACLDSVHVDGAAAAQDTFDPHGYLPFLFVSLSR